MMSPSKIWSFISLVSLCVFGQYSNSQTCEEAKKICNDKTKCWSKLGEMFLHCKTTLAYDPFSNKITGPMAASCPLKCVYAIGNLTSFKRGKNLEACDCENDAECLTVKARMKKCVQMASGRLNSTKQGCSEARKTCSNNASCYQMQTEFLIECNDLISGVNCTDKCKESLNKFLNSELGKALNECECDGYEEPYCRGIRAHYKSLCVKTRRSVSRRPIRTDVTPRVRMRNGQSRMNHLPSWMLVYSSIIYMVAIANVYR